LEWGVLLLQGVTLAGAKSATVGLLVKKSSVLMKAMALAVRAKKEFVWPAVLLKKSGLTDF
jgi:hypothetical protein